ncbi:MAG: nucleotidyltransferase domain-containing protein [Flavobacterium sp.]|nr:nucleotidyltransferase domain-containing protein [Flavobacterium sp.]
MRISEIEKTTIVNAILEKDKNAQIFLFGSRTDDFKKGGDIDILVQSDEIGLLEIVKIKSNIFKNIPEQKIDLLVSKSNETNHFVDFISNQLISLI